MRYDYHIFICNNQKAPGKKCCGEERGTELVNEFKRILRDKGLQGTVRAQRTGCLDACENGPALVIYPGGEYYGHIELKHVEEIINSHIINHKPIDELILKF